MVEAFTARHPDTEIFFASKACSNLWFLDQVRRTGINLEVNSGGELWKARRVGFAPRQIIFNGVAKTRDEIRAAVEAGVRGLMVDSVFELERIAEVAAELGRPAAVDLRVDVNVPTLTHPGLVTAHGGKAGIDLDDAPAAFALAGAHKALEPRGLHLHVGSQITGVEPYVAALGRGLDLIDEVEAGGVRLERLNAGGGFAIPYRDRPVCEPVDYFCSPLAHRRLRRGRLRGGRTSPARPQAAARAGALHRRQHRAARSRRSRTRRSRAGATRRGGASATSAGSPSTPASTPCSSTPTTAGTTAPSPPAGPTSPPTRRFAWPGRSATAATCSPATTTRPYRSFPAATAPGDVVAFFDVGAYSLEMMNPYNARPRAAAYAVEQGRDQSDPRRRHPRGHDRRRRRLGRGGAGASAGLSDQG